MSSSGIAGHPVTRREFIRGLIALGFGASPLAKTFAAIPNVAPVHVVIVGAGLAGLCAAYELERRGRTVTLLEADPAHIGGRVRTLRFDAGLLPKRARCASPCDIKRPAITRRSSVSSCGPSFIPTRTRIAICVESASVFEM